MKRLFAIVLSAVLLLSAACGCANVQDTNDPTLQSVTTAKPTGSVFDTENIVRITLYLYYGNGTGSDVPAEHMAAMTNWLASFTFGEEIQDIVSPGTDTVHVEIEYSDGTVIKNGVNTMTIDGVTYYIECGDAPECYEEILSRTSMP